MLRACESCLKIQRVLWVCPCFRILFRGHHIIYLHWKMLIYIYWSFFIHSSRLFVFAFWRRWQKHIYLYRNYYTDSIFFSINTGTVLWNSLSDTVRSHKVIYFTFLKCYYFTPKNRNKIFFFLIYPFLSIR